MSDIKKQSQRISKRFKEVAQALRKSYVAEAGWFPETGSYPNGAQVAAVATLQEYGGTTERGNIVPPRPFVRPTLREHGDKYRHFAARGVVSEIMSRGNPLKPMAMLSERVAGDLKQSILAVTEPPLAPMTIELRKRRWSKIRGKKKDINNADILEKPLIDTARLINSTSGKAYTK